MSEAKSGNKFLQVFVSELVLGALVATLSVITAVAGYQGSMADSEQTKYNVQGQQMLTDANAEYLSANQMIVYDYNMYDGWYTAETDAKAEYYQYNFSEELQAGIAKNGDEPFSDEYYTAMYAEPQGMFDESDRLFDLAEAFNERGDILQLVMMISALGLAFAAWASLLKDESKVRLIFAVMSILMLIYAVIVYMGVPTVTA
jgi:hypothetical protein